MAHLNIVRASAGSGKTFRLTLEYLSYLFDDTGNFRHILAVTFTNKATGEMKSRIISVLHSLSAGNPDHYLRPLMEITGKTEKDIRLKAGIILKKILHNYSRFSVGTIDSFFQYVIRSFTREIGIQSNYNLELDDENVLNIAIEDMFNRIGQDTGLRNWLIEFTLSRVEEEKGWNLKNKIIELGKEIFKEKYKLYAGSIAEKLNDKAFLTAFKGRLFKITASFESAVIEYGRQALGIFDDHNLSVDDFYQKYRGPAGFFQKMAAGNVPDINSYVTEVLQNPDKWFKSNHPQKSFIQGVVENSLHPLLQKVVDFMDEQSKQYHTARTLIRNFYTLGILTDITASVYRHTRNKNLFLISDSAQLINRIIDNNDAPFIYEKTGNYFHHFLIDEFQDTSGFQWQNFKPLISNSLSQDYNCLIVGDPKQSIYRWRNGDWEILLKDVFDDFYSGAIRTETLEVNWRSKKKIVTFNNRFFTIAPCIFQSLFQKDENNKELPYHHIIEKLYADVNQQLPANAGDGGYVRISVVSPGSQYGGTVLPKIAQCIGDLLDQGYTPGEIAILVRSKKEGKEVADFLLAQRQNPEGINGKSFHIVSEEALFIGSSPAVKFIISVFRYLTDPDDDINCYFMLFEYLNYIQKVTSVKEDAIMPPFSRSSLKDDVRRVMPEVFSIFGASRPGSPVYEILQKVIITYNLSALQGEQVYVNALQDMVIDFSGRNSSGLDAFLNYWEETGSKKTIPGADNLDAVRILTIHKSKGLEFNVVIMPFCNWKINPPAGNIIWCMPKDSPFNQLEVLPVNYGSFLENTCFSGDYKDEKLRIYIDNLNLLYVAFTRAKDALFCYMPADERKSGKDISDISHLIGETLKQFQDAHPDILVTELQEEKIFEYGNLSRPQQTEKEQVDRLDADMLPAYNSLQRMSVSTHARDFLSYGEEGFSPLSYGKIMHALFARVITLNDIGPALVNLFYRGMIDKNEMENIRKETAAMFSDIQVQGWFSGEWKILNERDILFKGHENKRPDRVLVKEDKAIIIDYKFGEKENDEHKKQVTGYRDLLKRMGYRQVEAYLWYTGKNKIIQVTE
ncbi:MAG: UvrD-helicase domain-containing protein [Bacteroidales bacterium]|nr:UvrD-helicase domain-containing protein [Bacteroidales bacterium]